MPRVPAPAGYSLAEAMIALALAAALTLCLAGILGVVGRLASEQTRLGASAETERTVAAILGAELRVLTAADVGFGSDSVRLRAFRGAGVVCSATADGLLVGYRGVRLPEPDKDSVLLVWSDTEAAFPIAAAFAGADCDGDGGTAPTRLAVAWSAHASSAAPAVALVFETGAYSIGSGALRYRRGAAGRQPLTETNLSDAGSGIRRVEVGGTPAAAALIRLQATGAPRSSAQSWTLLMPQESSSAAGHVP